jgi:hypothetical protein
VHASRLLASQLNALNLHLHQVAEELQPGDWLRRTVPGTNLPAFTLWHVARGLDSTVNLGLRDEPELIESEPWASKGWARPDQGTGYSIEEADQLAATVVPAEVLDYADALRAEASNWLKTLSEEDLDAPNALLENVTRREVYDTPAYREAVEAFVGLPVWVILSLVCFAHSWAHLEEIRLLAAAARRPS